MMKGETGKRSIIVCTKMIGIDFCYALTPPLVRASLRKGNKDMTKDAVNYFYFFFF